MPTKRGVGEELCYLINRKFQKSHCLENCKYPEVAVFLANKQTLDRWRDG
jgi:hypothetical protein